MIWNDCIREWFLCDITRWQISQIIVVDLINWFVFPRMIWHVFLPMFPRPSPSKFGPGLQDPNPNGTPKLRSSYLILRWKVPFSGSVFFFGLRVLFEYIGIVTDHMADGICQFSLAEDSEVRFCCGRVWRWAEKRQGVFHPGFSWDKMACILLMILLTISQLRLLPDKIQPWLTIDYDLRKHQNLHFVSLGDKMW